MLCRGFVTVKHGLSKNRKDKIEASEMWVWRQMERIKWVGGVSNKKILKGGQNTFRDTRG